jgi:apolipoprotein N-acyltransferase
LLFQGKMKNRLLLAGLSGLLFWASWPTSPLTPLIFVAFVPLFLIHQNILNDATIVKKGNAFFRYVYLALFIWNLGVTWWVWNASAGGAVMAIIANTALMTIPFALYHKINKQFNVFFSFTALIVFWLTFEFAHLRWDLSWTWLNIGNVFAKYPETIQWYEWTGTLGGTLWVLLVNIGVYQLIVNKKTHLSITAVFIKLGLLIIVPLAVSFTLLQTILGKETIENKITYSSVIVQPNIDPYTEKFPAFDQPNGGPDFIPYHEQVKRMINLSDSLIDDNTRWVVWPETSVQSFRSMREKDIYRYPNFQLVQAFLNEHPQVTLVTGSDTWDTVNVVNDWVSNPSYSKKVGHYKTYNTALFVTKDTLVFYHKSKLVPGVEKLPFPAVLGFVLKIIKFAGAGDYGISPTSVVYENQDKDKIASIVCYESIYGEHVAGFVKNGANILTIITNDGWWQNTQGHKQHNMYARLRAIETRRPILRSANTGISSFISISGQEKISTKWDEKTAFKVKVKSQSVITLYVQYGDWIGRIALFISGIYLAILVLAAFKMKMPWMV